MSLCCSTTAVCTGAFSAKRASAKPFSRPALTRARVVRVQAVVKTPQGVTVPTQPPTPTPAMFGFVDWAEKINGRACMIGFFALLLVEAVSGKGLLELAGFTIGKGLGFSL